MIKWLTVQKPKPSIGAISFRMRVHTKIEVQNSSTADGVSGALPVETEFLIWTQRVNAATISFKSYSELSVVIDNICLYMSNPNFPFQAERLISLQDSCRVHPSKAKQVTSQAIPLM